MSASPRGHRIERRPSRALGTGALAVLAAACAGGGADGEAPTFPLAFEEVAHETFSGVDEPLEVVVRDEASWVELWSRIHRGREPAPPRPSADFRRRMLITVATGVRQSSGFDVEVRAVALRDDHLEVDVLETCPAPGAVVMPALTQPVVVVALERRAERAVFRRRTSPGCSLRSP